MVILAIALAALIMYVVFVGVTALSLAYMNDESFWSHLRYPAIAWLIAYGVVAALLGSIFLVVSVMMGSA